MPTKILLFATDKIQSCHAFAIFAAMKVEFSEKIKQQLAQLGISEQQIDYQLEDFERGFPFANLQRPARVGDGIEQISEREAEQLRELFKAVGSEQKITRFVPASGAASRMFKELYAFLEQAEMSQAVREFVDRIEDFAFASEIPDTVKKASPEVLIDYVLNTGLGYGKLPKALIKFHQYEDVSREALAEHFYEASKICGDIQGNIHLHFSISPEHAENFMKTAGKLALSYGNRFEENFILEYSEQSPATQTIALDENKEALKHENGELLLRPGGHGALIHNLAAIYSDIIFIKNIDNVCHEKHSERGIYWKEVLAGKLVDVRQQVFSHIDNVLNENGLEEARNFLARTFGLELSTDSKELLTALNRPLRVCGMVKNEGKPGGGPFWVKNRAGEVNLQIVEGAQIDLSKPEQKSILEQATHFNPVDIVCSTKDYKGDKFKLLKFVDHEAGFISEKTHAGKNIKVMELPGLWNGAMANWLTLFVEVPVETFNPVKSVNDLLLDAHRA